GPNGGATADLEPKVPRDALRPAQPDIMPLASGDAYRHEKSNKSLIIDVVVAVVVDVCLERLRVFGGGSTRSEHKAETDLKFEHHSSVKRDIGA
ncbi:hypothetical protein BGZ81_007292, partial [Podila clonocystis]